MRRSKFIEEVNPKLAMFDLGNNVDHVGLKMIIPLEHAHIPAPDVNAMVNELITPTQVLVEEMVMNMMKVLLHLNLKVTS